MDVNRSPSGSNIKIAKLDELLSPHLAANEKIIGYRIKPKTAPGENFGSTLVSLDVDITNKDTAEIRTLHLVNKMIPQDQMFREIFNTKVTYFKEMDFYLKALSAMLKLQQDYGVPEADWITNIVPKCYGARHGFGSQVDSDAAILLENLSMRGYTLRDKKVGLNFQHALLVMEKLAYLHALPIALRKDRPDQYASCIESTGRHFIINEDGQDKEGSIRKFADLSRNVFRKLSIEPSIMEAAMSIIEEVNLKKLPRVKEPFVTLSHEDLWVNNLLFRADPENKELPAAVAFVDFQTTRLQSPVLDIVFFSFTSVTPTVRREHFDELFDAYHESFCKCLRQLKCDASEFSKQAFLAEMVRVGGAALFDIFNRLRIIEVRKEDFVGLDWYLNVNLGGQDYLERIKDIVLEFSNRGWLNNIKGKF